MVKDNNESKVVEVPLSTEKRIRLEDGEIIDIVDAINLILKDIQKIKKAVT